MSTTITQQNIAMAQFKFALIAPVIQELYPDASRTAYYKRVTKDPLKKPDGTTFRYNAKTLEKWVSQYNLGGMDALMPKERSDKGSTRALTDEAISEIHRLLDKYPRLNATQIHSSLIRDSFIPATVSVAAVQRFVKKNDLRSARNPMIKDRKAFEEEFFGGMFQADTCYLPYLMEKGSKKRCYLVMMIDDHSRMIVGGRIFYQDNAYNLQKVFKDAVSTYGIPSILYVVNGSPYKNDQLSLICGSLGTVLLHTPVRDGASKGKVERNFKTLKDRWLYHLDMSQIQSLDEFNELLRNYIRQHNTTIHSATGTTPMDRYLASNHRVKQPKSIDWLDECFMNRIDRKVYNDSTISIDGTYYDAPQRFIGCKVQVRYLPDKMEQCYIFHDGKHYPLVPTDKVANGKTKRDNPIRIDYSRKAGGSDV